MKNWHFFTSRILPPSVGISLRPLLRQTEGLWAPAVLPHWFGESQAWFRRVSPKAQDLVLACERLSDAELNNLQGNPAAQLHWLSDVCRESPWCVPIRELAILMSFDHESEQDRQLGKRERKTEQAKAIAHQASRLNFTEGAHLLDWCSGKGHLGRALIAAHPSVRVTSLEVDAALIKCGRELSSARPHHEFERVDVLQSTSLPDASSAFALHACGPLHQHLFSLAQTSALKHLVVLPCCLHKKPNGPYAKIIDTALAELGAQAKQRSSLLRLAMTGITTSSSAQNKQQRTLANRNLMLQHWINRHLPNEQQGYYPHRRMPRSLLHQPNSVWLSETLAQDLGRSIPAQLSQFVHHISEASIQQDIDYAERNEPRLRRLELPRLALGRVLEVYLLSAYAHALEAAGWQVQLEKLFCTTASPRNIAVIASRTSLG